MSELLEKGWICLHRNLSDWEWYSDTNVVRLWIHLLIRANHKDTKWRGILIKKGSFITGRCVLSDETGLSEMQVRVALDKLKSTNEITIKSSNKFSIITIVKWSEYQDPNQQNNKRASSKQPTDNQQVTTDNNDNNDNNETKKEVRADFVFWYSHYPHKVGRADAEKAFARAIKKTTLQNLTDALKRYVASKPTDRPWCNPATWLNQERWLDQEAPKPQTRETLGYTPLGVGG